MSEMNGTNPEDANIDVTPRYLLTIELATTAPPELDPFMIGYIGDAIWKALPSAHDGDVFENTITITRIN